MDKTITMTFHNLGLRSYIEVDLCSQCPREDDKGCCGHYSPVFYPCDFAYLLEYHPVLLDDILHLPNLTVLNHSITINNSPEGDSYRCQFHDKTSGCRLDQLQRESICRHFVCPGINWEAEDHLQSWKDFFARLADYENYINQAIAQQLEDQGLTLRNIEHRPEFFQQLLRLFKEITLAKPDFFSSCPSREEAKIIRTLKFGSDWPL